MRIACQHLILWIPTDQSFFFIPPVSRFVGTNLIEAQLWHSGAKWATTICWSQATVLRLNFSQCAHTSRFNLFELLYGFVGIWLHWSFTQATTSLHQCCCGFVFDFVQYLLWHFHPSSHFHWNITLVTMFERVGLISHQLATNAINLIKWIKVRDSSPRSTGHSSSKRELAPGSLPYLT